MKKVKINITSIQLALFVAFISFFFLCFSCKEEGEIMDQEVVQEVSYPEPINFDLDQIRQRGSITAILNNSSTGYFIYRGQPMGYEYELLTRLADELDLKLDIKLSHDIDEAVRMLNSGEGDIIAFNMAVTSSRKDYLAFMEHHNEVKQVLVQRKPENWRRMKRHQIEESLIRNPLELEGKEIHVLKNSAYATRLKHLEEEIGGKIQVTEHQDGLDAEALIKKVAEGDIEFTVADEDVALVNATYYPIIDVRTPVSFPQKIAWATRKNAPSLLKATNEWILAMKKKTEYYVIYNKYFKSPKATLQRVKSDYSSIVGNNISPYDPIIKQVSEGLGWDWRLLAAQVYQESRFDVQAESWAGAQGLMQLLPATGEMYGASDMLDPKQSLQAGAAYLNWLDKIWKKHINDSEERIKFVLASYNAGQGHVLDARRLAQKYGKNPNLWEGHVAHFLEMKSKPEYYNDPVATSGYCRGSEPVNYVEKIMSRFESYKQLVNPTIEASFDQPMTAGI